MDEIREEERKTEMLRARNETLDQEVSIEQKRAAVREAKAMYGKDWKKIIFGAAAKGVRSMKVNGETMQTLHGMGFGGGQELRDMNNPAFLRNRGRR